VALALVPHAALTAQAAVFSTPGMTSDLIMIIASDSGCADQY